MDQKEKVFLDPDHPLLQKFQNALKEHYLSQINRLKNEIFENELEIKKDNDEKDQVGIRAYEAQQMVCSQQKTLEALVSEVITITAAREDLEIELEADKTRYKESNEKLLKNEKEVLELQNEINAVNLLINQVSECEEKIESKITINQRIAEKTRKDNLKLSEEKRQQDAQIYKIMRNIWHLETEVETMNMQTKLKEVEREQLEQTVAMGNTNLEALEAEYRCLMHSWNSVVIAIGSRDRIVECLRNETVKVKEKIKAILTEIEQVKKLTKIEMTHNQRLSMNKERIEMDITTCRQQVNEEEAKINEYQQNIDEMQAIIDQTDKDIEVIHEEIREKELATRSLQKKYDQISIKKNELEKNLLGAIENQAVNDTVVANLYRILTNTKEKRKDLEIFMNEAENRQSRVQSEMEAQKYNIEESSRMAAEVEQQRLELEKEADDIQKKIVDNEKLFRQKERHVMFLNNKLDRIMEKTQSQIVVSPKGIRMMQLEKQIDVTQDKIKELQLFWLREQKNLLSLSEERQEQIHQINLLKKQLMILEQKNLKVNNDIENYKKKEEKLEHNINTLQNRATVLCDNLYKKKDKKSNMDKSNYYVQSQYDAKLKAAELECLQAEMDIAELEDEKCALSKKLIELNREALEWEKKVKMARQTKEELSGSKSHITEADTMKQEIQRMTVIYSQLKKAQDRLIKDLEHCVARRDTIFTVAEARQTRTKSNEQQLRVNCTRKMDDLKNKIKCLENDLTATEEKIKGIKSQQEYIKYKIGEYETDIKITEEYLHTVKDDIEESKTGRQLKFEILVMLQRKLTVYNDLAVLRRPFLYTKKENMKNEMELQKNINSKLCCIVQNLLQDCPNYKYELIRMLNSLKLSVYIDYACSDEIRRF